MVLTLRSHGVIQCTWSVAHPGHTVLELWAYGLLCSLLQAQSAPFPNLCVAMESKDFWTSGPVPLILISCFGCGGRIQRCFQRICKCNKSRTVAPTAPPTARAPTARHTARAPTARHTAHAPTAPHTARAPTAPHTDWLVENPAGRRGGQRERCSTAHCIVPARGALDCLNNLTAVYSSIALDSRLFRGF